MTDVKVVARLTNYCHGRQPRLQDCQSELVGAGSRLSSQRFGLTLHIRSLVLCRLWVLASANTHKQSHILTHIAQATCMHALVCAQAHTFESPTVTQLGIKTDTSRILGLQESLCRQWEE